MSTTTIEFRLDIDGVMTDPDSVVFSDPTDTYGVRRTDTNAIVVANNTALTRISTGVYSYTINDPASGLIYQYFAEWVLAGQTFRVERTKAGGVAVATSDFISYDEFVNRWGAKNVRIASNKDNTSAQYDPLATQQAFDYAKDQVYTTLRGGVVKVPLDFSAWSGIIPPVVKEWIMVIAYEYLYNARGLEDKDKVGNKLRKARESAFQEMAMVKMGLLQINAAPAAGSDNVRVTMAESPVSYLDVLVARMEWRQVDGVPRLQYCWTGSPTIP